jgi:hypothetical protein
LFQIPDSVFQFELRFRILNSEFLISWM